METGVPITESSDFLELILEVYEFKFWCLNSFCSSLKYMLRFEAASYPFIMGISRSIRMKSNYYSPSRIDLTLSVASTVLCLNYWHSKLLKDQFHLHKLNWFVVDSQNFVLFASLFVWKMALLWILPYHPNFINLLVQIVKLLLPLRHLTLRVFWVYHFYFIFW